MTGYIDHWKIIEVLSDNRVGAVYYISAYDRTDDAANCRCCDAPDELYGAIE